MENNFHSKRQKIKTFFTKNKKYALLFSGGFDSSCILGSLRDTEIQIIPFWVDNGFNRAYEHEIRQQALNLGFSDVKVIKITPLKTIKCNPPDRCYMCKKQLINSLPDGNFQIIDGTTADDLGRYRPGLKALKELCVKSPLARLSIQHSEAVKIAQKTGADNHIADMESCLATRFNYHQHLVTEKIDSIRKIERTIIEQTNDYNVRCRIDNKEHIRIEVSSENTMKKCVEKHFRQKIYDLGKNIAMFVTLDLQFSRPNEYDKKLKQ